MLNSIAKIRVCNQIHCWFPRNTILKAFFWLFIPAGVRSTVISLSVCLFVCLSVCMSARISKKHIAKFHQVVCTCYLCAWLGRLWRQCNALYTLGFVDDVMFAHNKANGQNQRRHLCFAEFARWQHRGGEVCCLRLHLVGASVHALSAENTNRHNRRNLAFV